LVTGPIGKKNKKKTQGPTKHCLTKKKRNAFTSDLRATQQKREIDRSAGGEPGAGRTEDEGKKKNVRDQFFEGGLVKKRKEGKNWDRKDLD